jgi:aspartate/methionine/tyrosine aminotransferase
VLITAGAAEANYLLFRQLLAAGDEIVTEAPGWPQAGVMAKAIGARLVEVARDEAQGWYLDPGAIAAAITPRTRMIFLTNPNNPTGRLIPEADLRALAALADRHGIWLVVDEVYAGLEWAGPRPPSVAGLTPFGITTGSVSKALGLQGLRTGWMICQSAEVIRDAMILRENSSEIMNTLGERIAEVALRPDRLAAALGRARQEGRATLDGLDRFVGDEPRLSWHRPVAGLIGLARVEGIAGEALARALLQPPWRTFLLPGSAYGLPAHVRLGAGGGPEAGLAEGLRRLQLFLRGADPVSL